MAALALLDGDADGIAVLPDRLTIGEPTQADLRPLQIGQDSHGTTGDLGGFAHPLIGSFMIGVVTVAEVEPCDVHSGVHQGPDRVVGAGSRTEGTDDLAAACHGPSIVTLRDVAGA